MAIKYTYKLGPRGTMIRLPDNAIIPTDLANADYKDYLTWLAEGNTPAPADPVIVPPIVVSAWQIRKALNQLNLREQVETAVGSSQDLKDGWEYSTVIERNHPLVVQMGASLGKTVAEMDGLFELARNL